ncbi:hypothetical protein [Paraflavitalea speifideaquila]|uniref:hypothetical protein n=1 Tax=Paraflavitalea speifideaquila TaxID=3076558 RepID=UPI0028EB2233|nr:hypothetical protein [Paraflavitalea speifideiaquila]
MLEIFIEFGYKNDSSFDIRKLEHSRLGKYVRTWHTVTDTAGSLKMLEKELIPALQTRRVKQSFTPMANEDAELLQSVFTELNKKGARHKIKSEYMSRIIGWVNSGN